VEIRQALSALQQARLYGIVDLGYIRVSEAPRVTRAMLDGGVQIIQLRAKNFPESEIAALARELAPLCRAAGVPFILNDHPALVPETGADGAHVGQDDLSVAEARALTGPGKIVGKSTHSIPQAVTAAAEQPDYIGFGPLFATPTKPGRPAIGLDEIRHVHSLVEIPIFCIGGIKLENLDRILAAGAEKARSVASETLARAYDRSGFVPPMR